MKHSLATAAVLMLSIGASLGAENAATRALDREMPEMDFNNQPLKNVIGFLQDISLVNLIPYWGAIERAGIKLGTPISVKVKIVPFKTILDEVLKAAGNDKAALRYRVDGESIVIEPVPDPKVPWGIEFDELKLKPVDRELPRLEFDGERLDDVISFLSMVGGHGYNVDWRSLEEAGIAHETPVRLKAKGLKCSEALRHIFSDAGYGRAKVIIRIEGKIRISAQKPAATQPAAGQPEKH